MPPRKKKQAASSQGSRRQTRSSSRNSVTTVTTSTPPTGIQPTKKRKVQDPLTKDDIPTIVKAVLEALPGTPVSRRADTTDAALDSSLQSQSSGGAHCTPPHCSQRDSSAPLSTTQQCETGNDELPHIDSGECNFVQLI